MKKEKMKLDSIMLMGISTRTQNKNELNSDTAKIGPLTRHYWGNQIANEFNNRLKPGVTYVAYTDYESDEHGEYTFFIGEAVKSLDSQDKSKFTPLIIPTGIYQKITTDSGKMPHIVISAWQEIWQMQAAEFGGKRKYATDFEVYDQRASDPNHTVIDIYLSIEDKI